MATFADILRADAAALERMLANGSGAGSGDAGREAKARRIGVNQTRLICGVGFNPHARQRSDFARMIGFNSVDALLSERNYRFIHDHYDELTVGNIIDIYTVVGHIRSLAVELYDPIFSRLQEIESELEGTINPILVSGYKLEIQSIHANRLASPELIARRLEPQYYVLRDIGGELPAMLEAGVLTQPQLLRHPGINVHEKSRLVFQGLIDKELVREYLHEPGTAPVDREVLQRLLH
ncbi:MAG: hypothetical protein IT494_04340 [Gammaproteobacteria bacterium]|nr:hypothetical protein [Gammaproteobacteria bacterium]